MPSNDDGLSWSELVSVGSIARAQGRFGEVAVQPSAELSIFEDLTSIYLGNSDGPQTRYEIENLRIHKSRPVLRLAGIVDISDAERLAGLEARVPGDAIKSLPEDRFYHFQVVGLEVWDRNAGYLGRVEELVSTGGSDVLVVKHTSSASEAMVPFCREICLSVDTKEGRIETVIPEGLLELNAH